ncbi:Uncharacterised protein [Yersinia frederiksenii]|uniref:Uncharacterized protein n=2 Tax=Yersinia frederiksenii TaxID=29484 RepID=A0A380PU61_YERFR|nr:hypothetical protein DJ58_4134 [Yersinia frederiksenii ATCC 33641]SUP76953.1 Uncharacterised protein [Yersinia frederiksenii]
MDSFRRVLLISIPDNCLLFWRVVNARSLFDGHVILILFFS